MVGSDCPSTSPAAAPRCLIASSRIGGITSSPRATAPNESCPTFRGAVSVCIGAFRSSSRPRASRTSARQCSGGFGTRLSSASPGRPGPAAGAPESKETPAQGRSELRLSARRSRYLRCFRGGFEPVFWYRPRQAGEVRGPFLFGYTYGCRSRRSRQSPSIGKRPGALRTTMLRCSDRAGSWRHVGTVPPSH